MNEAIRSLVVHLDGPRRAVERLQAARRIAAAHGAAVHAVYASPPPVMVVPGGDGGGTVAQVLMDLDEQRRAGARAAFRQVFGAGDARAALAEPVLDDAVHRFAAQAMYADLVVLAQDDPSETGLGGVPRDFPELVLARSGRPCLVLPFAGVHDCAFTTVAIAWKETPEAAHALAASLPILRKAARVHVLTWGAQRARPDQSRLDLHGYLQLHGVTPQWHEGGAEPAEIGELLLSRAADLGADLLVMGCYGHSRAREWIRGGASRTVLRSMTVPVLMAH